jgi:sulfite exporter TauE/SafE
MDEKGILLVATAAGIGLLHTLIGPDHYVPFIMMSRAGRWGMTKTLLVTVACGIGHVLSSVVLGIVGVAVGVAVSGIEGIEGTRGEIAVWLFIAFGIVYGLWGLRRARSGKAHAHTHLHAPEAPHDHEHAHTGPHAHVHPARQSAVRMTPWVLFVIFVFGPCEPLIPLLMYPAAERNVFLLVVVTTVFSVTTIATMTAMVVIGALGLRQLRLALLERYVHALAGGVIAATGLAIRFLGL